MDTLKTRALLLVVLLLLTSLDAGFLGPAQEKDTSRTDEEQDISEMWLNTVWKNIDEITNIKKSFEVEKVTTVAGVRGEEAEDEASQHLYYRREPSRVELQEAIKQLEAMIVDTTVGNGVPELKHYLIQCYTRLGDDQSARALREALVRDYPDSKWTKLYTKDVASPETP